MKIGHPAVEYESQIRPGRTESAASVNPRVVLEELFDLLEEYGPVWYTEEHRRRALAALSTMPASVSDRFGRTYSRQYKLPVEK